MHTATLTLISEFQDISSSDMIRSYIQSFQRLLTSTPRIRSDNFYSHWTVVFYQAYRFVLTIYEKIFCEQEVSRARLFNPGSPLYKPIILSQLSWKFGLCVFPSYSMTYTRKESYDCSLVFSYLTGVLQNPSGVLFY